MHKSKLILCFLYFLKNLTNNKKPKRIISKARHSRQRKKLNKRFSMGVYGKEHQAVNNKVWKARRRAKVTAKKPIKEYFTNSFLRWVSESGEMI